MSDQELDRLFGAYRDSFPNCEASPAFMPSLWEAIEARRTFRARFHRVSRVFVTAAGAIWLAMATLLIVDSAMTHARTSQDVDLLADSHPADSIDLALTPNGGGTDRK